MKKLIFILIALSSCAKTRYLQVSVKHISGVTDTMTVRAYKSVCIGLYDDSIKRLIDGKEKVLVDSILDYEVLRVSKKKIK